MRNFSKISWILSDETFKRANNKTFHLKCSLAYWYIVHTDMRPFFSRTFQGQITFDCFTYASRSLSAISARSRPYLRRQLCGPTIDTMLFTCLLSMHSSSLSIEGHVHFLFYKHWPSTLLTRWHHKIPCARDDSPEGSQGLLRYMYRIPGRHGSQGTSSNITEIHQKLPHELETVSRDVSRTKLSCGDFKVFCAQNNVALRKFYLFKDLWIRFKDYWGEFKDFLRTWANFSIFKDFSRGWCFFKDYWRPVRTT